MKLTEWLTKVGGLDVLPAGELHELRWWDITFLDGTSHLLGGGILVNVPVMNAGGIARLASQDGWEIDPAALWTGALWIVAYKLGEALVALLLPMTVLENRMPLLRYDEAITALRRSGF